MKTNLMWKENVLKAVIEHEIGGTANDWLTFTVYDDTANDRLISTFYVKFSNNKPNWTTFVKEIFESMLSLTFPFSNSIRN